MTLTTSSPSTSHLWLEEYIAKLTCHRWVWSNLVRVPVLHESCKYEQMLSVMVQYQPWMALAMMMHMFHNIHFSHSVKTKPLCHDTRHLSILI